MVHWPLMGGLLHLVQRGGVWAGCAPSSLLTVPNVTAHPSTASVQYQLHIIRCGTVIVSAHWRVNVPLGTYTVGHFGDDSFHPVDCIANDNQDRTFSQNKDTQIHKNLTITQTNWSQLRTRKPRSNGSRMMPVPGRQIYVLPHVILTFHLRWFHLQRWFQEIVFTSLVADERTAPARPVPSSLYHM